MRPATTALSASLLAALFLSHVGCGDRDADSSSGGSSGGGSTSTPATTRASVSTRPAVFLPAEQTMAAFFAATLPTSRPAAPPMGALVGTWEARIVSADLPDAPPIDPAGLPPFSFTITARGPDYVMASATGRGETRRLELAPDGALVARAPGAPDVVLTLRNTVLVGLTNPQQPVRGRMEFHATRTR